MTNRKTILGLLVAATAFLFFSCGDQPSREQIEKQIRRRYNEGGVTAAQGFTRVDEIQLVRMEETGEEDQWLVEALVQGSFESPAVPADVPATVFEDRVRFRFHLNDHGVWVGEEIPKHLW